MSSSRVVVAMSGGVDSSVAAALLLDQGYDVVGIMLRLWSEPPRPVQGGTVEAAANRCCTVESVHDARAVADRLGIPFYVIDARAPFKQQVVDGWIEAYTRGVTPNPCLACNRFIRFGFLLDTARSLGATHLATGHYARIRRGDDGLWQLWRGADRVKDQSYVLSVLGQADLEAALFPVGEYTKPQVRALAAERGLPTAGRADSQDLCFLADGDYRRFLREVAAGALQPGPIVDSGGRVLGAHRGLPCYTVGQRSGLGLPAAQPWYVLALDVERNALVVGTRDELGTVAFRTGPVHWVAGAPPAESFEAGVQIRYRGQPAPATITVDRERSESRAATGAIVRVAAPLRAVTPGQAAVFYQGENCLGNGLILQG